MGYQLPDLFVQLPVSDDDEFDHWELVTDNYRVRISRYYDGETSFFWIGEKNEEVPNIYGGQWTEAPTLEQASKRAWSAFCVLAGMDRAFGPAVN